jgi:chromate reductase, NAD(P)H dehydrogenase (quinone)
VGTECRGASAWLPRFYQKQLVIQYQVGLLIGSLRRESFNRGLAYAVAQLAPPEFSFRYLEIGDLPLYNQDDDADPHPNVRRLKSEIAAAEALLFVTPEYNRSIPGVLKNAIDHASRPQGHSVWSGKPAGVIGSSPGMSGSAMAQQHLRNILTYLDMPTLGQPEVFIQVKGEGLFDRAGNIGSSSMREFLRGWMHRYVSWVKQHTTQTRQTEHKGKQATSMRSARLGIASH